jgi:hypothetical protein
VRRVTTTDPQVMKTTLIGLAVAGLAAAAFGAGSAQSAASCTAGVIKVGSAPARVFCGPATAKVKIGGTTVAYRQGMCSRSSAGFTINIGTVVLGNAKKKPEYFGTTVKATPGAHANGAVAVVHANKSYAVLGTVTLKAGLKSGTFSGKSFGSPTKISGSFHC